MDLEVITMQGRQTAYKLWIAEIVNADYIRETGEWDPNYLDVKGVKVARVNILGTITEFFSNLNGDYVTMTIEDGTTQIAVRAFKEDTRFLQGLVIGNSVLVIGRPRQYQNEIYIIPEIVKKLDNPAWIKVRKAELLATRGQIATKQQLPQQETSRETREELIANHASSQGNESVRQKILNILEKQGEAGMDIDLLMQTAEAQEEEGEKIIEELIKEGEIYMSRPGVLKII